MTAPLIGSALSAQAAAVARRSWIVAFPAVLLALGDATRPLAALYLVLLLIPFAPSTVAAGALALDAARIWRNRAPKTLPRVLDESWGGASRWRAGWRDLAAALDTPISTFNPLCAVAVALLARAVVANPDCIARMANQP